MRGSTTKTSKHSETRVALPPPNGVAPCRDKAAAGGSERGCARRASALPVRQAFPFPLSLPRYGCGSGEDHGPPPLEGIRGRGGCDVGNGQTVRCGGREAGRVQSRKLSLGGAAAVGARLANVAGWGRPDGTADEGSRREVCK